MIVLTTDGIFQSLFEGRSPAFVRRGWGKSWNTSFRITGFPGRLSNPQGSEYATRLWTTRPRSSMSAENRIARECSIECTKIDHDHFLPISFTLILSFSLQRYITREIDTTSWIKRLSSLSMKLTSFIFWDITTCSPVNNWYFGGKYCLHFQGRK
jgi:hypothetical protein